MKKLFTLLFTLFTIFAFSQEKERQKVDVYGEFIFITKNGDTISSPWKAVGSLISVTKDGDTLEHVDLNDVAIGKDIIWSSSKISKEVESIWMQFYQNDNRILLATNERQILFDKINELDSLLKVKPPSSIDTIYVYNTDTIVITEKDTVILTETIVDTVFITQTITQFDTVNITETVTVVDTVTITNTDTVTIRDTIIVYDTVYVNITDPIDPGDTTVVDPPVVDCSDPLNGLRFLLIDVNTGDTLRTLKQTDTINKADGKFSIIVVSCDNSAIKGVTFFLDNVQLRREGIEPYAINGDSGGNYRSWEPAVGTYELKSEVESKTWSEPNRTFNITLTIIDVIGGTNPTNPTNPTTPTTPVIGGQFCEVNGLVTIEAESLDISGTGWAVKTTEPGYSGVGYLSYEGSSDYFNNPGNDVITAKINITNPGVYEFKWRNQAGKVHTTEENDTWLRFPDANDFYALKNGTQLYKPVPDCYSDPNANCPKGASNNGWFKVYVNSLNWQWFAGTSDNGPATEIFAKFDTPGIYTMEISARSRHHFIDKIVLYNNNLINESSTQSLTSPQTICEGTTIPTNPVNPTTPNSFFNGDRIALVHDGNTADADDHGAITLSLGMIKWAGLVDNLVFVGHSCIYKSPCNTTFLNGNDLPYNFTDWCNIMKVTTDDVMTMIGSNIPVYSFKDDWDDNRQLDVSVPALAAQMNASSSTSKLWVSCAGPMDVIYRALQQTDPSKLQYIHLVSHSSWNENSKYGGLNYNWDNMKRDFPQVNFHDILDQNSSNGNKDFKEEGKPTKEWNWMLIPNGGDQLSDYIHKSNNDGFMSNKGNFEIDWSDAGMVYWIISGGSNGGCENCGTEEVKYLFETGNTP